ncbi:MULTISPECIES: hypothetical protein [unclassified Nocardia]|uniref:hypothetical protein n=1 Tax=unclassified Nocardia TaxID=2637762 RepID=UPI001CE3E5D0|nr:MULTISPECIES: hypothetical protein [unclassified Nocardia]
MSRSRYLAAILVVMAVTFGESAAPTASAAASTEVEVKLNLVAAALDSSGAPNADVRSAFGLGADSRELSYEFLDTDPLELKGAGWSVRLRHKAGGKLDLNYKKRFPIDGGAVDAALAAARQQGFGSPFEAQVDWTYDRLTLSMAAKATESAKRYAGTTLPDEPEARTMLVGDMPGKLADWTAPDWGRTKLRAARRHGPVTAKEWKGNWQGVELGIEVVPVRDGSGAGTETVIELSFKTDGIDSAKRLRKQAISTLQAKGLLAPVDILKTDLILSRY